MPTLDRGFHGTRRRPGTAVGETRGHETSIIVGVLDELLLKVEAGHRLPTEPWFLVIDPGSSGTHAILGFTGVNVIVTDLDPAWVARLLPERDLSAPLQPPFLSAMEHKLDRRVNNLDLLLVGGRSAGPPSLGLEVVDCDHPRVRRARRYRTENIVYQADGGVIVIGRGLGGRWEVGIEVDEGARGAGLGRALAAAARHLVPEDRPVWAQIAPANAASVRAFLAAGYVPVGAEALLVERADDCRRGAPGTIGS